MILGDPKSAGGQSSGRTTIDDLFCHTLARRPDAAAIADPPNRASFTGGAPRRLTYAEADRVVAAIADRLRRLGLATDSVIGVQLPNTVESVLTILGVLRAGMIAAPLPLLWRRADAVTALGRIGARAIIAGSRVGAFDHCDLAMHVAAEVFAIRYVCGFGDKLADGVIPFDDLFDAAAPGPAPEVPREDNAAAHVAVVTFEVTAGGLVAVARNHIELIAGGLAALLEARIGQDSSIFGCCALGSFGGLAHTLMPWLMTGGTLSLHHGFDPKAFAAQCGVERHDTLILPGPIVPLLSEAGLLTHPGLKSVLGVWHAPERLRFSPSWRHDGADLTDLLVFGEMAVLGTRRPDDGVPALLPVGPVHAPRGAAGAVLVADAIRSEAGTLALRGAMVPRHAFPPGIRLTNEPCLKADRRGFVDTGYPCRLDGGAHALVVTGPPAGIVSVGGYRFLLSELQELVGQADKAATIGALPDALAGHRLSGNAADPARVSATLAAQGVNPLVSEAFRARQRPKAA